jgi:hypothetical protein
MKLVKEYINEKFTLDSDPIQDLGIGVIVKIKEWLEKNSEYIEDYHINSDLSIDVHHRVNLEEFCYNEKMLPSYIKFNIIDGDFVAPFTFISMRGFPKHIKGDFLFSNNRLTSLKHMPKIIDKDCCLRGFSREKLRKASKIKGGLFITNE